MSRKYRKPTSTFLTIFIKGVSALAKITRDGSTKNLFASPARIAVYAIFAREYTV
ncbi:hypothetical protein MCC01968_01300 [Bifidobacteriaceae bacterium MCC01968]|nr:hypothetical protein MCC01961_08310 [Bifidobacteriaceae bacterium MCC01961]GDZ69839.1 hypothetical protein MCC02039_08830 [Bifidobacteriaceae bacterium MCC02039]GDZ80923.1 hypothetical protein MCC01968_01300 [Bifidobacteriaceae bacterium MCC01968]